MHVLRRCVRRCVKNFACLSQFLCMAFEQLARRESLRDIEVCLRAQHNKLYHMGIRGKVSRDTLANANKQRDWRIYTGDESGRSGSSGFSLTEPRELAGSLMALLSARSRLDRTIAARTCGHGTGIGGNQ